MRATRPLDLVVLGTGLSGLVTAWALARRGLEVRVLDTGNDAARTLWDDDEAFGLVGTAASALAALLASLPGAPGLLAVPEARARWLLAGRRGLRPIPRRWTWPRRLGRRRLQQKRAEGGVSPRAESLAVHGRRRFGARLERRVLEPLARLRFGACAWQVAVADVAPALAADEEQGGARVRELLGLGGARQRLPGGGEALAQALRAALGSRVTPAPADLAMEVPSGAGPGAPLGLRLPGAASLATRRLVLAEDLEATTRRLAVLHPPAASLLRGIEQAPRVTVDLAIDALHVLPDAAGFLGSARRGGRAAGAAFVREGAAGSRGGRVRMVFGGRADPEVLDLADAWIERLALAQLRTALGPVTQVREIAVHREPRAYALPPPGLRGRLARVQEVLDDRGVLLPWPAAGCFASCVPVEAAAALLGDEALAVPRT